MVRRRGGQPVHERPAGLQRGARRPFQRERLRYDASFATETSYAYEHGIPWSEYLDRFEPEDRAIVIAVAMEKSDRCVSCGTSQREWDLDPFAYTAVRVTCPGCRQRETLQADTSEHVGKGMTVQLVTRRQKEYLEAKLTRAAVDGSSRPRRRRAERG
ncbi:MAG: hypothetical protein ABI934_11705 [Actinomycetota bacterium]